MIPEVVLEQRDAEAAAEQQLLFEMEHPGGIGEKEEKSGEEETASGDREASEEESKSLPPLPDVTIPRRKNTTSSESSISSTEEYDGVSCYPRVAARADKEGESEPLDSETDLPFVDACKELTIKPDETPFVPPSEELTQKIIQQVEYYFSDASIVKDAFLLKHVRRNKEGYVSLKLISCFKRVKHLTKDWRQVAHALRQSEKLEVNEEGTKVRRRDPLPPIDETTPSRTVVAYNMPLEKPNIENVAELFSKCGEIVLIRILNPNNPIPNDIKQFLSKHAEIGNSVCALVEFEKTEYAKKAVEELSGKGEDRENWRAMKVLELSQKPKKEKTKRKQVVERKTSGGTGTESQLSGSEMEDGWRGSPRRANPRQRKGMRFDLLRDMDSSGLSGSESEGGFRYHCCYYSHRNSISTPGSSPCCSPTQAGKPFRYGQAGPQRRGSGEAMQWHRRAITQHLLDPNPVHTHHQQLTRRHSENNRLNVPENVMRFPRGPDGSRGFYPGSRCPWNSTPPSQPLPAYFQKPRSGSVPAVIFTPHLEQAKHLQRQQ